MVRSSFIIIVGIFVITFTIMITVSDIMKGNTVRRITEAQIQTTTTDSNNDTEETTSLEANSSRLVGSQPDRSPIHGTGIPSEQTNANPAPQAPISGMEVRTRENETREGTGAFVNFTNTTR